MKRSLTKKERIASNNDIRHIFSEGKKISCHGLKLYWIRNSLPFSRMAVTLSRKYGNAVERNKSKRWIREIYRELKEHIVLEKDILFLLFPGDYSFAKRKMQVYSLLKKAGLLIDIPGVTHG